LAVGLAVGLAARTARRAHDELQRAARLAASLEERERLSRQVHDGVIQVLALVAKRGHEIGGATSELAKLASEQERALRSWVTSTEMESDADASKAIDLRALLRRREADRVSMSLPGTPVLVKNDVATELDAAVGNALDNVHSHAGPAARAFVLLEDLGESVTISIRDDGPGIAPGRLEEAASQGHVGISKSIVGRLMSMGGSAELHTNAGEGTEWELSVPRRSAKDHD
jgi:signal transduction histidine kinase